MVYILEVLISKGIIFFFFFFFCRIQLCFSEYNKNW